MNISERRLDAFSLAALLVSGHYGLGFILGTAEQSLTLGAAGSLYAVSLSLGTIALLGLAKFYWTQGEQIWTLLGNRYGSQVKILVGLMSWSALIGIEAVQIISGAFILKGLGAPLLPSMIVLAILFTLISLLPVEKASWLFQGLLGLNFLALLYGLWVLHGFPDYLNLPFEFVPSLALMSPPNAIGTSVSTVLVVLIDMKCQQFVVQAKDLRSLYQGCSLAAMMLLLLALLPSAIVIAAQKAGILPVGIDGKETLPSVLTWIGGGNDQPLGIILILSLLVPALGVGSSLLRVQNKTILDFNILPVANFNRLLVAVANALLSLAIALKSGGALINLIVSFYAVYVAAVLVPFIAYLLAQTKYYTFSEASVKLSLTLSSLAGVSMLILTFITPSIVISGSVELNVIGMGVAFGILGLSIGQAIDKYFPASKVGEDIL